MAHLIAWLVPLALWLPVPMPWAPTSEWTSGQRLAAQTRLDVLLDLGRWDTVIGEVRRRLAAPLTPVRRGELERVLARAWVGKGETAFSLGDFGAARDAYDRAMAISRSVALVAKDRWAYCHCVELADRMRDDQASGDKLEAKLRRILETVPDCGYARYLLGVVLVRAGKREAARRAFLTLAGPGAGRLDPEALRKAAFRAVSETGVSVAPRLLDERWRGVQSGGWQRLEGKNFVVVHRNRFAAERVLRAAEFLRIELYRRWLGAVPDDPWRPRCVIHLYPDAQAYRTGVERGSDSPAHSTIRSRDGRVLSRRLDCRQDDPLLLRCLLPHELTHLVVQPRFLPGGPARWADEGLAVLAEHEEKRGRYDRLLADALATDDIIPVEKLLRMEDYPAAARLSLYYAQCGSLVQFLLNRGSVEDVLALAGAGTEAALRRELERRYDMATVEALQRAWTAWARARLAAAAATRSR